jgi:hypothetical protein
MSVQVDVLAVMDRAYSALYVAAENENEMALGEDVLQAGAAVAELIEAARGIADNVVLRETSHGRAIRAALARCGVAP